MGRLFSKMWSRVTLLLVFCLLGCAIPTLGERVRYDNYAFYKISPQLNHDLEILKDMKRNSDSLIFIEDIHVIGRDVTVVVAPHKRPDFELVLKNNEIVYELMEENFQAILDEENAENEKARAMSRSMLKDDDEMEYDWTAYHTIEETYSWLLELTAEFPSVVLPIDAGVSYERRRILGIMISMDKGRTEKPGIFLEGGIHAREWISPAVVTYIVNELLKSTDPQVRSMAEKYNWYIVPHANPDGYAYTHTTSRLWRKTRTPYGTCFGADPNRNWDFYWGVAGVSDNPCEDTYAGPSAFSEIETYSFARYLSTLKNKIHLYLAFHSYSQLLLFPYGHTSEKAPNHDDMMQVFNVTVDAIKQRFGTVYTGGNIYDAIYPASGSSMEWAYGKQDVKMAFTYELRPRRVSIYNFRLPASQIIPTGQETLDSLVVMVKEVDRLGYFKL